MAISKIPVIPASSQKPRDWPERGRLMDIIFIDGKKTSKPI
jgi:hypothetical protein